ncbi:hypothetical protein DKG77_11220 [Flagellimonas aquimarina]|uniref:Uncharacterized protein n=1 Tax=Flagellimonas aquimarina TaxID=2201895 RepID=A0A316KYW4_9FLAO|nr:DUF4440 domain-containing protein [Allomuricauda koreensis]PWL38806.1 hypothetical protein DKG77_11220 [Allomuricauda koreensis]
MKQLFTCVALCFFASSIGQETKVISEETIISIKKDIWIPFMEAYANLDSEKLKSIHSADIVRIYMDQNTVENGQSYMENFGGFLDSMKQRDGRLGIAFAILSTAIDENEELAYQTGYYRFSSKRKDDAELIVRGYGLFSVGIKKIDGVWKLWLDSDKRINIDAAEFNNQDIIYELND